MAKGPDFLAGSPAQSNSAGRAYWRLRAARLREGLQVLRQRADERPEVGSLVSESGRDPRQRGERVMTAAARNHLTARLIPNSGASTREIVVKIIMPA